MDGRVLTLAVPSAAALALLVWHSMRALPRRRALAFWACVAAYGVARGVAVRLVTERALHASFPYVVREPLVSVLGVSLQEVAGWAIVSYLGWWLGWRFARTLAAPRGWRWDFWASREQSKGAPPARKRRAPRTEEAPAEAAADPRPRLYVQVLWAALFLGAVSWAVEATAGAAGWWAWTVPAGDPALLGVPFIGLVDWFFVGIDFLLPFVLLTSAGPRGGATRWAALGLFPVHFASHALTGRLSDGLPVPVFHLVHWALLGTVVWLALRSRRVDEGFVREDITAARLPLAGACVVLGDAALVQVLALGRFDLLPSVAAAALVVVTSLTPLWGVAASVSLGALGIWTSPFLLAAVPATAAVLLRAARRGTRGPAVAALAAIAAIGVAAHTHAARREADLTRRLGEALRVRDHGDLDGACALLEALVRDHPESHAPPAFLGEIDYKRGRLHPARAAFRDAVAIKRNFVMGHRYLAVIAVEDGRLEEAAAHAREGLLWAPDDLELLFVRELAGGGTGASVWARAAREGPTAVLALASLATETGHAAAAASALDESLGRWPDRRELYAARTRIALDGGDTFTAQRVVAAWRARLPRDPEAAALAHRLGD